MRRAPALAALVLLLAEPWVAAAKPAQKPAPSPIAPAPRPKAPPPAPTPAAGGVPATALEVTADSSLEWLQDQMVYIARGNAVATRNGSVVKADTLTAHYRDKATGSGTEVYLVEAEGHVSVESETSKAYGDHGVYDVDKGTALLTGKALKYENPEDVVTARDSLEYDQPHNRAIARGDAKLVRGLDVVTADVLTAIFRKPPPEAGAAPAVAAPPPVPAPSVAAPAAATASTRSRLSELQGDGNVVLTTPTDVVTGDHGTYDFEAEKVLVTGRVRITRGESQLDGARAEVDLQSGISRMLPAPGQRVRALIVTGGPPLIAGEPPPPAVQAAAAPPPAAPAAAPAAAKRRVP